MTDAGTSRASHGRRFDVLATVLIGIVVTGAALVPAITANAGGTTTIRGDVEVGGDRLAFFPVGFWAPGEEPVRGTTDANGVFTLDVPQNTPGYAFAGSDPDARSAITMDGDLAIVRGIIGGKAQSGVVTPLYQGWDAATGRSLAGGAARLHLHLQEAGRISGTSPVVGAQLRAVQVRRLDGSVVQTPSVDPRGRFTSRMLAPGRYVVAVVPRSPLLPTAVQVDVHAGGTVTARPPAAVVGAAIEGVLTAGTGDVAGVPVLLQQGEDLIARTTTGPDGRYRFAGLVPGDYTVEAGRFASEEPGTPAPSAVAVPVPGATPTPTPTPTATVVTPSPSPTPSAEVLQPIEHVSGAVRPVATDVTVPDTLGTVQVVSRAESAGRLGGRVTGGEGEAVRVVVEDAAGRPVGAVTAGTDGSWSIGGLATGQRYTAWAVTSPTDPTTARMGTASGPAGTADTGTDIEIDRAAATMQGTVQQATGGSVVIGDAAALLRSSRIDASGAYAVQGLVPGLYRVVVRAAERLDADPVAVTVTDPSGASGGDADRFDLQRGPQPATYRGWFISGGAGVPSVMGTATSASGATAVLGPETDGGYVEVSGLRPGTYSYDADSFAGTVPVVDGPWWFSPPVGTFALSDGATTFVGPVVLHVRAR